MNDQPYPHYDVNLEYINISQPIPPMFRRFGRALFAKNSYLTCAAYPNSVSKLNWELFFSIFNNRHQDSWDDGHSPI